MTLEEAIEAVRERSKPSELFPREEHEQMFDTLLLQWLEELKARRGGIDHPAHYTACGGEIGEDGQPVHEAIKVIERLGLGYSFCVGSAVKYLLRAPYKGAELQDLLKARWYLKCGGLNKSIRDFYCPTRADMDAVAEAWKLSPAVKTALMHIQGGWSLVAVRFVEDELDSKFPEWRSSE